jgi:hypothetical protein
MLTLKFIFEEKEEEAAVEINDKKILEKDPDGKTVLGAKRLRWQQNASNGQEEICFLADCIDDDNYVDEDSLDLVKRYFESEENVVEVPRGVSLEAVYYVFDKLNIPFEVGYE